MKQLAIFASGEGTNAQHIINHFQKSNIKVALIVCNNPKANVIKRAEKHNIPTLLLDKALFYKGDALLRELLNKKIDFIVCAGFLWKIPHNIIHAFPNKIINVHPALLPKFGGKGMYGMNVHKAVINSGEKESGITIHYINEQYDEGEIILQKKCEVTNNDTPETLAHKVHELEHAYFPKAVEEVLKAHL